MILYLLTGIVLSIISVAILHNLYVVKKYGKPKYSFPKEINDVYTLTDGSEIDIGFMGRFIAHDGNYRLYKYLKIVDRGKYELRIEIEADKITCIQIDYKDKFSIHFNKSWERYIKYSRILG